MKTTTRIRLLTIGSVLATALAIGAVSFSGYRTLLQQHRSAGLDILAASQASRLGVALNELQNDVRLMATLPAVRSLIESSEASNLPEDRRRYRESIAGVFEKALRAKAYYAQIRLIGVADGGREIVRVDRLAGVPIVIAEEKLQLKGSRDYFLEAIELPSDAVYLSSVNLNQEHGKIEVPHRPVIRAAMRIDGATGEPFGIAIINMDFSPLVDELFDAAKKAYDIYVTNEAGDYLMHPDPAMAFGFDLGTRHRAQQDFEGLQRLLEAGDTAVVSHPASFRILPSRLASFHRAFTFPEAPDQFLTVGVADRGDRLSAGFNRTIRQTMLTTALLTAAAVVIAVLAGRAQTIAVDDLAKAARALERGEELPNLPVERRDEIGMLARAFQQMAESLTSNQQQLVAVNDHLRLANEDLEHFTHIAAHDLREPLRKQRSLISLLIDQLDGPDPEVGELLRMVWGCSDKMQTMIDDFRALTRFEAFNLTRESVSLEQLIDDCLVDFEDEITFRGIRIERDPPPPRLWLYPSLVSQLYTNLIRNAISHTQPDGFLLSFTIEEQNGEQVFGVRNSGSRIPEKQRAEVFKLFRRGGAGSEGGGVGLTICRKIVERHHGKIWIDPNDEGVHFRFTLGGAIEDQAEE